MCIGENPSDVFGEQERVSDRVESDPFLDELRQEPRDHLSDEIEDVGELRFAAILEIALRKRPHAHLFDSFPLAHSEHIFDVIRSCLVSELPRQPVSEGIPPISVHDEADVSGDGQLFFRCVHFSEIDHTSALPLPHGRSEPDRDVLFFYLFESMYPCSMIAAATSSSILGSFPVSPTLSNASAASKLEYLSSWKTIPTDSGTALRRDFANRFVLLECSDSLPSTCKGSQITIFAIPRSLTSACIVWIRSPVFTILIGIATRQVPIAIQDFFVP